MPYTSNAELPAVIKKGLSESEQTKWRSIFNTHFKGLYKTSDEAKCLTIANGVVKGEKERLDSGELTLEEKELVAEDGSKYYQYVDSYDYSARSYTKDEAEYNPVGGGNTKACSNCRWYIAPSRCAIVGGDIVPNGVSALWAAVPKYEPTPMPVVIVGGGKANEVPGESEKAASPTESLVQAVPEGISDEKGLITRISTKVAELVKSVLFSATPAVPPVLAHRPLTILQTKDGRFRFMAVMTNNFKDRDKEVFTEAAHKEYVDWAEKTGTYPELWLWHTPGSKMGQADWLDYADGFVVASGWIDAGKESIAEKLSQEEGNGVSHGFVCLKTKDGTIVKYRSYELSPLPLASAANEWTSFNLLEAKENEMGFTEKRREWLANLVGEETVKSWETNTETLGTTLKDLGVEFKSKMESADESEAAVEGEKALAVEVAALTKAVGDTATIIQGLKTELETVKQDAKKSKDELISDELTARTAQLPQGHQASTSSKSVVEGAPSAQAQQDADWFNSVVMGPVGAPGQPS